MIAAEFFDPESREPSAAIAQAIQQKALSRGLLLLICGQYGNVIRFLYPLTIPDAQFTRRWRSCNRLCVIRHKCPLRTVSRTSGRRFPRRKCWGIWPVSLYAP
jgi:acetylornithine/succinyldiaminopimelate/putrescine aminotransferase